MREEDIEDVERRLIKKEKIEEREEFKGVEINEEKGYIIRKLI